MDSTRARWAVIFALFAAAIGRSVRAQTAEPADSVHLTLAQATALALENNVSVSVAKAGVDEAAGARTRRLAQLLPHAAADAFVNRENRNLAVAGLSIPNVPTVVGPFSFMDLRLSASQSVIDRQAYHEWKASTHAEAGAALSYQDVRDLVVRQVTGLYLTSEAERAEVDAANSRVSTSLALETLAEDQRGQGLATGIDVVRAELQLSRDRQNVLAADDDYQNSLLALARFLGLPLDRPLSLSEPLAFHHVETPPADEAVQRALGTRADYRALLAERDGLAEQQRAAGARALPKVAVVGDYGLLGRNVSALPGIGEVQATVTLTLFDRDRRGETEQVTGQMQALDAQLADLARSIEQELRKAILDLQSTEEEVRVADATVDLATRELTLAEDRFRNGVSDNVEVVAAQDAIAATRDARIAAIARHADAAMALARAQGETEQAVNAATNQP